MLYKLLFCVAHAYRSSSLFFFLFQADMEVVVDIACGMAVLRGADVFKQGILGAPTGIVRLT